MSAPLKNNSKNSKLKPEASIDLKKTELQSNEKCVFKENAVLSDNIIIDCSKNGNLVDLIKAFEEPTSPYKDSILTNLHERDSSGKTGLDWCCIFGTAGVLVELIKRGANINNVDDKGYTALHYAAAWDKVICIQILINAGADIKHLTNNSERSIDIAKRYKNYLSLEVLENCELKLKLKELLLEKQKELLNGERSKALSKDEKAAITAFFKEKIEYLTISEIAGSQGFQDEEIKINSFLEPYFKKMNEGPAEKNANKKK